MMSKLAVGESEEDARQTFQDALIAGMGVSIASR